MDANIIFFSKTNYILGEKIRNSLRKINLDVMYCNDLSTLIYLICSQKNNIVLIDKVYRDHANLLSQLAASPLQDLANVRFVYMDDDFKFYANNTVSERFFHIPETNLESALFNIITKCQMLNIAQENISLSENNYGEIVSEELKKLGFSYKLVGFRYIRQCIEQAIKNNFVLGSLYKDVYPIVGIQNSTSATNIERGIRTAIVSASKQESFRLEGVVGNYNCISNRFFLEYLLDRIRSYKNKVS